MARVDFCQLPGWQYEAGESTITMIAPDIDTAEDYLFNLRQNPQKFIRWQEPVEIYVKYAEGTHRYRVPITNSVGKPKEESDTSEMKTETQINPITLTPDADYQRVSEWLIEKWNEGKSVCVTSQIDNKCLFQNDKLTTRRAVIQPHEFIGQNYLWYWRDTMDDYHQLRQYLDELQGDRDYLAGFEYRLRRPDGALCRYQTDYYRGTFLGVPVRIGVSNPADWEILEPVA